MERSGDEPTIADLGEDGLLARIFPLLPHGTATLLGPGDDAAVVAAPDGRVVVSTDVLVEGRHFRQDWSSGADVGWRAAMQNLADIAAMGARPTGVVVSLVTPVGTAVRWVLDLAKGLAEACSPYGVGVVGGDLSSGAELVVSVTVLGDLEGRPAVLRSGARPGDVLAHAGVRGRSAAGLALLTAGRRLQADGAALVHAALVDAYRRPRPPVEAGVHAARSGATAMLDVSDGLLRDAGRLARASEVVLDVVGPERAFGEDVAALVRAGRALGVEPLTWVLTGGEDHGLLATFPPGAVPAGFTEIGTVTAPDGTSGAGTVLVDGRPPGPGATGWDHFRP